MNWRKRKKLRKIAHEHGFAHYYEWRSIIKSLCHLKLYIRYCKEGRREAWRVLEYGKSAYEKYEATFRNGGNSNERH